MSDKESEEDYKRLKNIIAGLNEQTRREAVQAAGIIDKDGKLTKAYGGKQSQVRAR